MGDEAPKNHLIMKNIYLIWPTDIAKQSALYPPLGLASLAAVLRQKGFPVRVFDLSFDRTWAQIHSLNEDGGIYGISFTSSLHGNVRKCIGIIRARDPRAKIVLGGPHASVLPEDSLNDLDADVVCIGEAEVSFPRVVDALLQGSDLSAVDGIAFRDRERGVTITPDADKILDLDSLPLPDQSLFPYEAYFGAKGFRELSIITSRGCPNRCTFCQPTLERMFGRKIRYYGSDYVVRQIRSLQENFRLDFLVISDDTFVTNKKRALELCRRIVLDKISIFWRCQTGVNGLDRELIRGLKKAGCFIVALGVESGSQDILDHLQKSVRVERIKAVFKMCHEEGMLTHAYLMVGSPGESAATIEETRSLLKEIRPFSSNICLTTPYPGTSLYDSLKERNLLEDRAWDDYDHLLSDSIHIKTPDVDLAGLNRFKRTLLRAQKYPLFKLRCLVRAFADGNSLRRLFRVARANPGIVLRGLRLFYKSLFAKGLELSNPATRANALYAPPAHRVRPPRRK